MKKLLFLFLFCSTLLFSMDGIYAEVGTGEKLHFSEGNCIITFLSTGKKVILDYVGYTVDGVYNTLVYEYKKETMRVFISTANHKVYMTISDEDVFSMWKYEGGTEW